MYLFQHEGTLRRRFFAGELPAEVVVRMDPNELKEGYTAEETRAREPVAYDPEPIEVSAVPSFTGLRT